MIVIFEHEDLVDIEALVGCGFMASVTPFGHTACFTWTIQVGFEVGTVAFDVLGVRIILIDNEVVVNLIVEKHV